MARGKRHGGGGGGKVWKKGQGFHALPGRLFLHIQVSTSLETPFQYFLSIESATFDFSICFKA